MDDKQNYITIKEYARVKDVSVSAVYKRLNGSLKDYVKEVDGKKFLDSKVLEDEGIKVFNPSSTVEEVRVEEVETQSIQPSNEELNILKSELEAKNKLIESLMGQIIEKDKAILEQNRRMTEQTEQLMKLLEQSNTLNYNNQMLLAEKNGAIDNNITEEIQDEKRGFFGWKRKR